MSEPKTPLGFKIIATMAVCFFILFMVIITLSVLQTTGMLPKAAPLSSTDYLIQQATQVPGLRVRIILLDNQHSTYTGPVSSVNLNYLCLNSQAPAEEICVQQR